MKLLRYGSRGAERPGILDHDGHLRDLSAHVPDIGRTVLLPEQLEKLRALDTTRQPRVDAEPRIAPCVAGIGEIICTGLNYSDHAAESNMPVPTEPVLFMKPTSAVVGPNDDVEIPPLSEKTDWEIEVGIVIGKPGRYISPRHAPEHIAG